MDVDDTISGEMERARIHITHEAVSLLILEEIVRFAFCFLQERFPHVQEELTLYLNKAIAGDPRCATVCKEANRIFISAARRRKREARLNAKEAGQQEENSRKKPRERIATAQ